MPEATLLVRADGMVLAANRRSRALLEGLQSGELIGRPLRGITDQDPERLAAWLRNCARSRSLLPGSLRLVGRNGVRVSCRADGAVFAPASDVGPAAILVRLTPQRKAVDRFVALNLRIEELTSQIARRHRAEQALRAEREWLRVTLESIGDAVIATDGGGRITFLNAVAENLTGWLAGAATDRQIDEVFVIINEYTREPTSNPVGLVLSNGDAVGLADHTILVRRDGSECAIDDTAAPIRDEHGEIQGVVLVFHEITERRRLERQLRDADRRKDEFLAMLAHELRNPLAPLRSGIDVVRLAGGDARRVEQVSDMMSRQVQHLTRLVDDLLDVSRITNGSIELRRERLTLQP
ncbi:MAG: PAS domain-containing protein, partial [Pseudomonadales bacterium]